MSSWKINNRIEVTKLMLADAADGKGAVGVLSTAVLAVPMQLVDLKAVGKPVIDSVLGSIPSLDSILAGTSSLNLKPQSLSVHTLPGATVQIGVAAELNNPLPFSASIGWLSLDAFIGGAALGHVTVAPFNLGRGRTTLSTTITIAGAQGDTGAAADNVAALVRTFLAGGELAYTVGVGAPRLGASDKDVITAFEQVRADIPLQAVLKGTHAAIDLAGLVSSRLTGAIDAIAGGATSVNIPLIAGMSVAVGQVSIAAKPGKQIAVATTLRINADFALDVQVGHFAAGALLNGVDMVSISADNLAIKQNADATLALAVQFADGENIQKQAADLVAHIFDNVIPGTMGVGRINLGASSTDTLSILSKISVDLPIDPIAKPVMAKVQAAVQSVMGGLGNSNLITVGDKSITITLTPTISIIVRDLSVATAPQKTLSITVVSDIKTPLPLSIDIPYVGAGVAINDQKLVSMGLRGVSLKNGSAAGLSLTADLTFDGPDAAANEIAHLVDVLMRGDSLKGTRFGVLAPAFGVSRDDSVQTFARVALAADAGFLDPVVANVRALVSKTIGALNPVLTSKGAQGWSLQLASALGVDVSAVDVKSQGSALLVNVDASLRLPIKLRANLGYVAAGLSYNGAALVSFETGIQLDDKLNKLSVLLRFSDADDAQTQVAALVASVLGRASPVPGTFGVSRAVVGASHDDAITAFQAVRVELAAQTVLAPVLALLPASLDIVDIATQFGVQLGAIDVKSLPDRRLAASVQVALTNPMPLSVQLGYASLAVGSDNVQFATASLSNLVLSANGKNQLTLATEIAFPDNAAAQAKLAALVADPAKATVFAGAIRFGGSPQESTALLAKTHIDAPVSMVNNDKFINFALKQVGLTRDDLKLDALIKRVALDSANVVVASTVVVDGSVTVTLPVALTVDMPVVALVAYANGSPLSGVNVRDLKISSAGGKLKVGFRAQLDMAAADAAQQTVADLINKFLAGDTQLSLSAGIGSLLFGATEAPKDVVTIARQVRYDLDVSGVIGYFRNMLPAKLDLVDLAERFGVQVSKVAVGAAPGAKITASAQVAVNLNLPINLSVDYTALTVGLGDASVVTVELGQLALHAGQKDSLSVTVKASFDNSDAAQNAVAAFVKQPSNIYFTGVRFGASVDNNIRLLAKARLVAPASLVSNDKVFDYVLKQVGLTRADLTIPALIKRLDITSLDVALAKKTTVHAVASLALPVDIKVNMPYAGASAYLDGVLLASAGVFDLAVTSRDGRVFVDTRVEVDMSETDATQTKVADLVDQLISGKNITLSAGADSVAFGASPTDAVRTLTKVHLDLDVTPVLGQIKDFASGYIKTVFDWLKVEALTTGVVDQHTLAVSVAADISKLPLVGKISLSLKYASLDVALNNMHVLSPRVTSLTLAGGKVKAAVLVDFDLSGPSAAEFGEVLNQIGDLVFYKPIRKRAFSATVSGIKFGASPSSPVMIAGKVKATVDAIPYLNQATDWYTKSSVGLVKDIQATLTPAGIDVDVLIKLALPIELPVSLEFGSLSARIYYRGFGDAIMVNNWVTNIQFSPSGELRFHLLIDPVWDTVMNGLNDAVPLLVSWKDVAQNAFLGGFRMHNAVDPRTATPAQTFLGIDSARMSPPPLILYSPLSLRPILVNPFKEGLGINLDVGFTNPGPIHINIGKVYFGIVDGNKAIGGISLDNAVLRNHAESNGGKNDFLVKARLTLHLLDIPGLLIDLLAHREKFGYKCDIRWDDKELVWINRIVERLPPALLTHIVSILVGLIRNSSIHLFAAEGQKLAAANPALVADAAANNGTAVAVAPTGLSRRWLTKRADETITKIELSKWTADPVISPDFSQFVKVDWSALAVATE
ncbi:hypothetical protein BC828DRAFT_382170 [Blastocladiella britannica]|nr:hypothetical protein BC828DRAFT_382170 [Blastocladiella britannica]